MSTTKQIISSLLGKRIQLLDDSLFEEMVFGPEHVVHKFGAKSGSGGVAGPLWEYTVTPFGHVKFSDGEALAFSWDKIELQGQHLFVTCGRHSRQCSYFYRDVKRFVILGAD